MKRKSSKEWAETLVTPNNITQRLRTNMLDNINNDGFILELAKVQPVASVLENMGYKPLWEYPATFNNNSAMSNYTSTQQICDTNNSGYAFPPIISYDPQNIIGYDHRSFSVSPVDYKGILVDCDGNVMDVEFKQSIVCPECKGEKFYIGLNVKEPCKKCKGIGTVGNNTHIDNVN